MAKTLTKEDKKEIGVKMISAVNEVLAYKRMSPDCLPEEAVNHIVKFCSSQKSELIKFSMISAASKAIDLMERNPKLKDRDVLGKMMSEIPKIIDEVAVDYPR